MNWEKTSYPGIVSTEDMNDQSGDRLRYFKLSKGAIIPLHSHKGYEKILILSGLIKFIDIELSNRDILYTSKNEEHSAIAIEETLMLVINERV